MGALPTLQPIALTVRNVDGFDMTIETHRPVEIEGSRVKMFGLAALGILMTALSASIALRVLPNVPPGSFAEFFGYVGTVLFGACTALILWRAFTTRGPVVTITADGIRDSRIAAELIPWSAVNDIKTWESNGQRIMVLSVDPAVEAGLSLTRIARWTRGANRTLGADGLCITAQGLKMGFDELIETSVAFANAWRSGVHAAEAPRSAKNAKAQFTAVVLLEEPEKFSFGQLQAELARIAPQATLGDWQGAVTDAAADPGIEMLNVNGENLSVLVVNAPAPAEILEPGPYPNPLWPNAETEAAHHKAHIIIVGFQDPVDGTAALATARAVTLLTAAIVRLTSAVGVAWFDGANVIRAAAFAETTKDIGQPDANAVPFWVRLLLAEGQPDAHGEPTMKACTFGLRIFGLREVEYAPAQFEPAFILQHAYSVAEYLLRSGRQLEDGETIGVEGQTGFAVSHVNEGDLVPFPVARLRLVQTGR